MATFEVWEIAITGLMALAAGAAFAVSDRMAERKEQRQRRQVVDEMLWQSGLPHPYRLPYETDGDALDRIQWGAQQAEADRTLTDASPVAEAYRQWVEHSGVVNMGDDGEDDTIPCGRVA